VVFFYANVFYIPRKVNYGFREAATALLSSGQSERLSHLVSTDTSIGEGIFVFGDGDASETRPEVILRASKVLADKRLEYTTYKGRYASSEQLSIA